MFNVSCIQLTSDNNVFSNLERAFGLFKDNPKFKSDEFKDTMLGIELIEKELINSFDKNGIKSFESMGKKFEADKKLYSLFKQEINDNIREEEDIPELFKDIYPIFEKMDNEGYLNTIQEINKYVELLNN